MTNEELVNNVVCKACRVCINTEEDCNEKTKECCFSYSSALQIAKEKDKQYQEEYIQHFDND